MAVTWRFILTDLTGVAQGEVLNASARSVTRALSAPSTASFTVPVSSPHTPALLTQDLNLRCYRNGTLMFHGPTVSVQLAASDPTTQPGIAVTATDPAGKFFPKRLAGKSATGTVYSSATDRLTIAEAAITAANSEGETGITVIGQTCGTTITYTLGPYKKLEECIRELSQALDGFDWRVDPTEYTAGKIGRFYAAATIGSQRDGAVFEYQGRGNMRVPDYQRNLVDSANKVYHIPDDGAASALGVRSKTDSTSVTTRGLLEDVAEAQSLTDATVRDKLLDDHIAVRKDWRSILTFSPDYDDFSGRVPAYGTDYEIGDLVRGRVLYDNVSLVDGFVRLYKMKFDIDAEDRETLTPTVVDE